MTRTRLLWFDKTRGRAHESTGGSGRTMPWFPTNMSTKVWKSTRMSLYNCVCQGRDSGLQLSQERFPWSGSQDMHETASVCSHHARLLWARASASAFDEVGSKRRLNTIVAIPIERDDFVQKYLSCLIM